MRKTGLLIAVTETDEVNIIACMLAKRLGVERTVARLRNQEDTDGKHMLQNELMGIDYVINPERLAAEEIAHSILNPSIVDSDYDAGGRVHVSGYKIDKGFPYLSMRLQNIKMPASSIICAIIRGLSGNLHSECIHALGVWFRNSIYQAEEYTEKNT